MGAAATQPGDFTIAGNLSAKSMTPIVASVNDASVQSPSVPANAIQPTKIQHQPRQRWSQPNSAATTETRVLHRCYGAAAVIAFHAGAIVAPLGAATVTIDLQKNGVSILTAVITLNNTLAAYGSVAAGLAAGAGTLVAGDVITCVITATAGGGTLPTGVFCEAVFNELPG